VNPVAVAVLMTSSFLWAIGSLYSREALLPRSTLLVAGMEMLCGGALLAIVGLVSGETRGFHPSAISLHSALALGYLVVFGSLVAFTAFAWLLQVGSPAKVSTYGYVNPMVAVILGWVFRGEQLSTREIVASLVIVGAVVVIITSKSMTSGMRGLVGGARARARARMSGGALREGHDAGIASSAPSGAEP
jgi:drug/metabolite transporter (DMT)-like permease